ncbi:hypothetical protein DRO02_04650 [archaeon]|nr:MAG: hypothetical protein DRO02_04650 [archaeon]RLG65947.1 MAG: hypothetical protein DRO21_00715 [archaeon]HDM24043.1 hypothetical protein [Candidatus Bathyarchaeota archaeon]
MGILDKLASILGLKKQYDATMETLVNRVCLMIKSKGLPPIINISKMLEGSLLMLTFPENNMQNRICLDLNDKLFKWRTGIPLTREEFEKYRDQITVELHQILAVDKLYDKLMEVMKTFGRSAVPLYYKRRIVFDTRRRVFMFPPVYRPDKKMYLRLLYDYKINAFVWEVFKKGRIPYTIIASEKDVLELCQSVLKVLENFINDMREVRSMYT